MQNIFLNNKGQYLVVTTRKTRASPVSEYTWVDNIDGATVFNHTSKGFDSRHFFPKWHRDQTPLRQVIAQASVEVVSTVTIAEMTAVGE